MTKRINTYARLNKNLKANKMNIHHYFLFRLQGALSQAAFDDLQDEFGGSYLYFPKASEPTHIDPVLARHIADEFTGFNIEVLAHRYNLSLQQVYQIVLAGNPGAVASGIPENPPVSPIVDPQTAAMPPAHPVPAPDDAAPAQPQCSASPDKPGVEDSVRPPTQGSGVEPPAQAPQSGHSTPDSAE